MIGVDVERHGRGVDGIDHGDRPVHGRSAVPRGRDLGLGQVDVFAHGRAGGIQLRDNIAPLVVDGEGARMRVGI